MDWDTGKPMDIEALSLATPAYSSFFERKRILVTGGAKGLRNALACHYCRLPSWFGWCFCRYRTRHSCEACRARRRSVRPG
ncbi:hypothetical protein RvY_08286-2 [Ramazzottius varieornatus]|uniref:Uncharacterized protein n=1 Tax=Ramazzottius varieornatus TaxID=947166 RepID=A0A1D1VEI0_RAMVA|nr:hypothetical protein RvY_08286-2 [Ramazzottius varieornatus]